MLFQNCERFHTFLIDYKKQREIGKWVKDQFGPAEPGLWSCGGAGVGMPLFRFYRDDHAMLFKLMWNEHII